VRVIGGIAKGRKLRTVPSSDVRPITDRVKESLFNILGPDIQGATFWDLFAGTGSVGIEALSRGARCVRFVDKSGLAIKTIRANLKTTGLDNSAEVIKGDSFSQLAAMPDQEFDYVYVAPPQYKKMWVRALQMLEEQPNWLAQDAWVIAQIDPVEDESLTLSRLDEFDRRKYGSTLLLFYQQRE
jgi:16S rRNA (guanine(966)-N(2))-methyltransferase RsmD